MSGPRSLHISTRDDPISHLETFDPLTFDLSNHPDPLSSSNGGQGRGYGILSLDGVDVCRVDRTEPHLDQDSGVRSGFPVGQFEDFARCAMLGIGQLGGMADRRREEEEIGTPAEEQRSQGMEHWNYSNDGRECSVFVIVCRNVYIYFSELDGNIYP